MVKPNFDNMISRFFQNHPGIAVSTILFVTAFSVFSANAILYQPNSHPQPLWKANSKIQQPHSLITGSTPIPYRRVETVSFRPENIAIPTIRPHQLQVGQSNTVSTELANDAPETSTKEKLAYIQQFLKDSAIYDGNVDGVDGPKTRKAIKKFQKSRALDQTGKLSIALMEQVAVAKQNAKRERTAALLVRPADAKLITRVQIGLINFGERSIKIDGVMGNNTAEAIRKFQQRFKLDITGKPSQELVRKLEKVGALTRG